MAYPPPAPAPPYRHSRAHTLYMLCWVSDYTAYNLFEIFLLCRMDDCIAYNLSGLSLIQVSFLLMSLSLLFLCLWVLLYGGFFLALRLGGRDFGVFPYIQGWGPHICGGYFTIKLYDEGVDAQIAPGITYLWLKITSETYFP